MSAATVIEVELLSGRYHAHVWGEAQFGMAGPEWPPSPWRLLRALASAWFCARPHPSSESDRDGLLETLGRSGPPQLWLPRSSLHEVRYYQPVRLGASDRVLHHDHFAVAEGGRFWFQYDVDLPNAQRALLENLLARIRYFGRSESRARLRLTDSVEPRGRIYPVVPRSGVAASGLVTYRRALCTNSDFRAADLWLVRAQGPHSKKKRSGNAVGKGNHPAHLVDTLLGNRMPLPCGARWVEYAFPAACVVHEIRPCVRPPAPVGDVKCAEIRFRLSRRIPIPMRLLVAVARAFREAVVEAHRRIAQGEHSKTLIGREADGSVARGHEHAYYLPSLRTGRLTIDELVVRVPSGKLTRAELDALLGVERIYPGGRTCPITVAPEEVIAEIRAPASARRWRSMTPFVLPLSHRRGRDETCIEQQAAACVERLCGRRPVRVDRVSGPGGLGNATSLLVHEYAHDGGNFSGRRWKLARRLGFWLELVFDEPVALHVPVGADAHFGAGQFGP